MSSMASNAGNIPPGESVNLRDELSCRPLPDITLRRLSDFRRRRLRLAMWRGVALVSVGLVASLLLAIGLDALVISPLSALGG